MHSGSLSLLFHSQASLVGWETLSPMHLQINCHKLFHGYWSAYGWLPSMRDSLTFRTLLGAHRSLQEPLLSCYTQEGDSICSCTLFQELSTTFFATSPSELQAVSLLYPSGANVMVGLSQAFQNRGRVPAQLSPHVVLVKWWWHSAFLCFQTASWW